MGANRKRGRLVILVVEEEQGGVLEQAARGTDRPVRSPVLASREQVWMVTLFSHN
jgi:hypothetical protein